MPFHIQVADLACERGERLLFQGVGFQLKRCEALLITGPNGIGKTTLLRTLAGFVPPASGTITFEGDDTDTPLQEHLHFIGHRDGLRGALTVRENLALAPLLMGETGLTLAQAAERLRVGSLLDLPVSVLSAGQRRRTALARLLVTARPIWLLDEPTASLDAASTEITAGIIRDHVGAGGIVVAATHLPLGLKHTQELAFAADGTHQLGDTGL